MIALSRHLSTTKAVAPLLYRLCHDTMSRLFTTAGAAAAAPQPQLDPDYFYNSEAPRSNRLGALPSMTDTESSVPRRGVQWAFIGSPCAKKRVYAGTVSKLLQVPCISMASLVNQELNPRSSLYKQIANAVNRGMLVPEDIIFSLLSKRLEDGYCKGETGFILDGIPRSQFQAEILDQLVEIDLVVNFKCTDDILVTHQQGSVFPQILQSEHLLYCSPNIASRHSSNAIAESAWKEKLQAYVEQSQSLIDHYQRQKKLLDFQVLSAPKETWQGLLAALHLQHMNAVYSSKTPTTTSSLL